jgi:hypothetical protein
MKLIVGLNESMMLQLKVLFNETFIRIRQDENIGKHQTDC